MTPKEMFYHGHLGGSALEIVSLMACSVCFMYLRTMYGKNRDSLLVDFFMIVVPMVLRLTVWSEFYLIDVTMMVISFASYFLLSSPSKEHNGGSTKHLVWVSLYRSFLMIITCICILAVDFPVFPRRYFASLVCVLLSVVSLFFFFPKIFQNGRVWHQCNGCGNRVVHV